MQEVLKHTLQRKLDERVCGTVKLRYCKHRQFRFQLESLHLHNWENLNISLVVCKVKPVQKGGEKRQTKLKL